MHSRACYRITKRIILIAEQNSTLQALIRTKLKSLSLSAVPELKVFWGIFDNPFTGPYNELPISLCVADLPSARLQLLIKPISSCRRDV